MRQAVASVLPRWVWNGGLFSTRSAVPGGKPARPSAASKRAAASSGAFARKVASAEASAW